MENLENADQLNGHTIPPPATDIGDAFGHGWETLKKYFIELLMVTIISVVVAFPTIIVNGAAKHMGPAIILLIFFAIAYGIFLQAPIDYGVKYVFLRAVRGQRIEIKDVLRGFDNFINVVAANVLVGIVVAFGLIFLIVPGIILACKLAFVPYLVIDKKMDAIAAFRKSWDMTKGVALTIFLMGVISFFLIVLGLILLIVGVIPASIWISSAFASLYYSVDARENGIENGTENGGQIHE